MIPAHLTPPTYKITCECLVCGHVYTRKVRNTAKNPPCPRKACREAQAQAQAERMARNLQTIIGEQRAPGITGSNVAKAIDTTAEIVMKDYGLTDMKDNTRDGESAVPRLPAHQQARVDGFWGNRPKHNPAMASHVQMLGARALAGSFAPKEKTIVDYALSPDNGPALKPQVRIIASDRR